MNNEEKKLRKLYRDLAEAERDMLLAFAEFLAGRSEGVAAPVPEPALIAPKENESVVAALKRLSASYPMLDKGKMLNETSVLMSQHVLQGRDKDEVIAELEVVFKRQYEILKNGGA